MNWNIRLRSAYPFDETLEILRDAIQAVDMMVLHEIDTSGIIRRAGVETMGICQLLFFHPRYMKRVLETERRAVIEAPLKLLILEDEDGADVVYLTPQSTFGRYAGLEPLANELQTIIDEIVLSVQYR